LFQGKVISTKREEEAERSHPRGGGGGRTTIAGGRLDSFQALVPFGKRKRDPDRRIFLGGGDS